MKQPEDALREIPPGQSHLDCTLHIDTAGEFSSQLHFYFDDDGLREIVVYVRGSAKAQ